MRRINGPHWIKHSHLFDPDEYECSVCHVSFENKYPSCPSCRNPMNTEREEQDWVDEAEEISWLMDDD